MTNFTGWIKSLFIFICNILLRNKLWQSFDLALAWVIVIAQLSSFVMHVNNDKKVMLVNIFCVKNFIKSQLLKFGFFVFFSQISIPLFGKMSLGMRSIWIGFFCTQPFNYSGTMFDKFLDFGGIFSSVRNVGLKILIQKKS